MAATTLLALGALAACGEGNSDAEDPSGGSSSTTDSASSGAGSSGTPSDTSSGAPSPGSYPHLDAEDYTYVLDTVCYCPLLGPTRITVEDGEVTSAVASRGGRGVKPGSQAPEFRRLTINDIIDEANNPRYDKVKVDWPDGQDWPNRVQIDQMKRAIDDEITYVIKNVRVG